MSGFLQDKRGRLYDPDTRTCVGHVDDLGNEVITDALPTVEHVDRMLTPADCGGVLNCPAARVFWVPTGLGLKFNLEAVGPGAVTFESMDAEVTDFRTAGAGHPYCRLLAIGPDTYGVYGSLP